MPRTTKRPANQEQDQEQTKRLFFIRISFPKIKEFFKNN